MITQNITATIIGGTAPYSYTFSSSLPCVSFNPRIGVSQTGVISGVQITYDTIPCADSVDLTLTVIDANGCLRQVDVPVNTTCGDLDVLPITFTPPYTFTANVTHPGCGTSNIS